MAINETATGQDSIAITGTASGENSTGIHGKGDAVGVRGDGKSWHGVVGFSEGGFGVYGEGLTGNSGVVGKSKGWHAVGGFSESTNGGAGIYGEAVGPGVMGVSKTWHGAYGETTSTTGGTGVWGEHKANGTGVVGKSAGGVGVWGTSESHEGVHAETKSPTTAAIAAYNLNPDGTGAAIFAKKEGTQGHAGFFDGNVWVGGEIAVGKDIILANADCAEDFDIADADSVEPGIVMVLGEEDGALQQSQQAYDKRVAGVISGAGDYKPGLILDKQRSRSNRKPIALLGKVFCKVDASYAPIEMGDLLTTSPTLGHAMKATDPLKAFGAVIGKALRPLKEGRGLIPILIALQ